MNYYTGMTLPRAWRAILAGEGGLPQEPLYVNWISGPDCVVGEVRIKHVGPQTRVLHFALMDDGWEADEATADGADTIELALGGDSYTIFVLWDDDPDLISYFDNLGVEVPSGQPTS